MTDDCRYGVRVVSELLERFGFESKWSFVDVDGNYYGISKAKLLEVFKSSDLFIDSGSHGGWMEESESSSLRAYIDTDPGFTQMKWQANVDNGIPVPVYDGYFTNGMNVGTAYSTVPTAGVKWGYMHNPVSTKLFLPAPSVSGASYSTVMNWSSGRVTYHGKEYGHKDLEFQKILSLPLTVSQPLEVAVAGTDSVELLQRNGWKTRSAHAVTQTFESFHQYLIGCRGELSVCKNMFVENNTGWFSDKSAAFLACGRPVVLQDTGFSRHLPVGKGLMAFSDAEEAREAINRIESDYSVHSREAREIAHEHLEATKVLRGLLESLGI